MPIPQPFRLDGRIAFVSGARGHLGAAMTRALAGAGAHVIVNGRDDSKLARFQEQLGGEGFSVERATFDIADIGAVRAFFAGRERLDILVNNAVSMQVKGFSSLQPQDFAATYESASVVNVSSMYGQVAPDGRLYASRDGQSPFHYGPVKAALLQLTRHLAAELGSEGIRVNALVPGPFPAGIDAEVGQRLAERTMLGRLGKAAEIAGPLLFLASNASSYMTGAVLNIDGGWTAW